jgi:toxin FitB
MVDLAGRAAAHLGRLRRLRSREQRARGARHRPASGPPPARGRGDRHQASALERWLRDVETGFEDRVLPVTLPVAAAWGRQQYAQPLPVIDALIAATARVHGMTVVTRNVKDFELAGVQVLNPFVE